MYKEEIDNINRSIEKNKKAIISLGCSFVQGLGAISQDIYDNYNWQSYNGAVHWFLNEKEKNDLILKYPRIKYYPFYKSGNNYDFTFHEYDNSFVNILCKKYFNENYTPINLGVPGCGNRATIKELYYYPDILWDKIEEIIVIYCPSGPERFDFINDKYSDPNSHDRWKCAWPRSNTTLSDTNDGFKTELWNSYNNYLYSEKFSLLEQIANVQELLLWCKYKNARLIITSAFNRSYEITNFKNIFNQDVIRDDDTSKITGIKNTRSSKKEINNTINMWPWENMFKPDGCPTFMDLVLKQEFPNKWEHGVHFYDFYGKGSPGKWVTPCAHPSANGHAIFAQYLYNHITENIL